MATINERLEAATAAHEAASVKMLALLDGMAALPIRTDPLTLYVSTAGDPSPINPVGGDRFDTIVSAMTWLRQFRLTAGASVIISVAAGTYVHVAPITAHPDGAYVSIVGAALVGAMPVAADFGATGYDEASRDADNAANLTMLASKFAVRINAVACDAISLSAGERVAVHNILFVGDGTSNCVLSTFSSAAELTQCSVHGFLHGLNAFNAGEISADSCTVSGSAGRGLVAVTRSYIAFAAGVSRSNALEGVFIDDASSVDCDGVDVGYNGANGIEITNGSQNSALAGNSSNNGDTGYYVTGGSTGRFSNGVANANANNGITVAAGSNLNGDEITAQSNGNDGLWIVDGSTFRGASATTHVFGSNGRYGIHIDGSHSTCSAATASNNGNHGIMVTNGGRIVNGGASVALNDNGGYGVVVTNGSFANMQSVGSVAGNTGGTWLAQKGSFIVATGSAGTGSASPTINTVGNDQAYIKA